MKLTFILLILFNLSSIAAENIAIITKKQHLENQITKQAIEDVQTLLKQACGCEVTINNQDALVQLHLPEITPSDEPSRFAKQFDFPYLPYPDHDYSWTSKNEGDKIILTLSTPSYQGISNGLYGLLQEHLGFLFYHPRETIVPSWTEWPLKKTFEWTAKARFEKRGFHLHTQHPLELTEALMNPEFPDGQKLIREYIDWLARNQQNYFEFNLLEGIDPDIWPHYAKQFVDYGHSRGLLMGLDVSLRMIQQKSFMLYKNFPASFRSKKKQLERNMKKLFVTDWDVWSVEFSTTEFTGGNVKKKKQLQLHLTDKLTNEYNAFLTGRIHVVKADEETGGGEKEDYALTAEEAALDQHRGVLVHTVMCYSISEEKAPVYQNKNLRHMLDILISEKEQRETWYYPESAYWVTFDNSIPILQLTYLSTRLDDIQLMDSLGIPGHLTFSSGWEWGYWLIDWSIARWSWKHEVDGKAKPEDPTMFLHDIFKNGQTVGVFDRSLQLQETFFKEKELMQFMVAQMTTDELPPPMNLQLAPRPDWTYKWFRYNASMELLDDTERLVVRPLLDFFEKANALVANHSLGPDRPVNEFTGPLFEELQSGLQITALRAKHRANTLSYLISKRRAELTRQPVQEQYLDNAVAIREEAQQLVNAREQRYRYPVEWIARKHWSHTAYNYGYLYPVANLHFWHREEEQLRKDKYGPLFMNIWDMKRIIGITE